MNCWHPDGRPCELADVLGLSPAKPARVIAAVGAGGKTSTLYDLAEAGAARGLSCIVTTTTHMSMRPDLLSDLAGILDRLAPGAILTVGSRLSSDKFGPLSSAEMDQIGQHADLILVEADGSRQLPLKVPAEHEPVIPAEADTLLVLLGLSAVNQPLAVVCHRLPLALAILGDENRATAENCARLLQEGYLENKKVLDWQAGKREVHVVLNQADSEARRKQGAAIAAGVDASVLLTTRKPEHEA